MTVETSIPLKESNTVTHQTARQTYPSLSGGKLNYVEITQALDEIDRLRAIPPHPAWAPTIQIGETGAMVRLASGGWVNIEVRS